MQQSTIDIWRDRRQPAEIPADLALSIQWGNLTIGVTPDRLTPAKLLTTKILIFTGETNTGTVYLGGSQVASTNGYPLLPGDSVTFAVDFTDLFLAVGGVVFPMDRPASRAGRMMRRLMIDISTLWCVGSAAGQSLRYSWIIPPVL